ncbi:MAG: MaoC family dehydratase [Rhodospirillales bacterium]
MNKTASRFFDDFKPGDSFVSKGGVLTEPEIMEFGRKYDPQPFHIDKEVARKSIFGGLIASGFQTIGFSFKQIWDTGVFGDANLGGHGIDEVRWLKPVFPGEMLTVTATIEALLPSKSRPDRGTAKVRYVTRNSKGEPVFSMLASQILKRRPPPR